MLIQQRDDVVRIAEKIMQLFFQHQRQVENKYCSHYNYSSCFTHHYERICEQVAKQKQITFVLPAFPAKSPNRDKTMGPLPDLGERLALRALNGICQNIVNFYPLGARMVICSDGRVFNDLVKVKDEDVDAYALIIREMIAEDKLTHLSTFSLDDYFENISYAKMRIELINRYGENIETIREGLHSTDAGKLLFNGIHRFMFEDQRHQYVDRSNTEVRKIIKNITYQVIQRSNAWGNLIATHFPDAIRLSIHPQLCGSKKLGVMLLKSKDGWATPWHRVVLAKENEYILVRRREAVALGASPQFIDEKFSHYCFHF